MTIPSYEESVHLDQIRGAWRDLDDALGAFIGAREGDGNVDPVRHRSAAFQSAISLLALLKVHEALWGNCGPEPIGFPNRDINA
jgi:hypothetical protein